MLYWGIFPFGPFFQSLEMSSGEGLLFLDWTFILTRATTMDSFLRVVPFLGDFYISCRTEAYSPIC